MISWLKRIISLNIPHYRSKLLLSAEEKRKLSLLQKVLGFRIKNKSLFLKALTHRSYLEVYPNLEKSNERLEFLGDAVLNLISAKFLFKRFPYENEGYLTKKRAFLVNKEKLYASASKMGLKDIVLFNNKYIGNSSEGLKTILADALEALIGAIYLEKSISDAEKFISKWILSEVNDYPDFFVDTNYKGQLLEYTHAKKLEQPKYKVVNEIGPEHNKEFTVEVSIAGEIFGVGKGNNKKNAEQEASKNALIKLKSHN
ncbi:ribonuclease III [Melioribacteraceae bacterium 4301-Me]|uniref:ribonuclease III n=1 Tax=Pyranulibacter aquaticus TaxID=3163344 RepID=UPI00359689B8